MFRTFILSAAITGAAIAGSFGIASAATAPPARAPHVTAPSCYRELAAYRHVSRQAGLVIGSDALAWRTATGPRTWARELRRAGDVELARTAAAIHGPRSADQFVMALTASADADLAVLNGGSPAGVCSL